ncbi:hypothetical protein [Clostridium sp. JN-9]|uniref:hypothetical protein n=1 Tax=Clostridium sp. JN-9 TaxID=2507159 RepID=UPI000FFDFD14|nr:hypothetical protein [Clostridium sp. JN-9]QAT40591.1 hypothetical protein EQM05_10140 [Clostridium sp. JN-9]
MLVTSTSSLVKSVFTYTVKIVMNRYYVRGADGVVRYQVYATYYDNSYGGLLGSQIVQQGVV